MSEKSENIRMNFFLPKQHVSYAKKIAKIKGTSVSQLVRDSLAAYLRDEAARLVAEAEARRQATETQDQQDQAA